jgi:hypothetical protein
MEFAGMHPLLKAVGTWIPPIARLAADRDVLHAQAVAMGLERDAANAARDQLHRQCEGIGTELATALEDLKRAQQRTPFRPIKLSDVEHDAATPDVVAATLARNQMCLVRGALPAERCAALRRTVETVMAPTRGGTYGRVFGEDRAVLRHVLASPCLDAARSYFRAHCGTDDMLVLPHALAARKFIPSEAPNPSALPFHQDAFGFPPQFDVVNCWTLLSPDECGETAPGLEFIPDGIDTFLGQEAAPTSQAYGFLETPHHVVAHYLAAYDPWRPSVRLGDVMMFTKFALHRTALHARQHRPRYSAEIRLVANTTATAAYLRDHPADAERVDDLLA